jgi:hypothetical protein
MFGSPSSNNCARKRERKPSAPTIAAPSIGSPPSMRARTRLPKSSKPVTVVDADSVIFGLRSQASSRI